MLHKIASKKGNCVLADDRVFIEMMIVDDFREFNAIFLYGEEGKQSMVDGAELSVGDHNSGKMMVPYVVDG